MTHYIDPEVLQAELGLLQEQVERLTSERDQASCRVEELLHERDDLQGTVRHLQALLSSSRELANAYRSAVVSRQLAAEDEPITRD